MHTFLPKFTRVRFGFISAALATLLLAFLAACNPGSSALPSTLSPPLAEATPSAISPEPAATLEPDAGWGTISGDLGFPSEEIPPLRIYAVHVDTGDFVSLDTYLNQTNYSLDVPAGVYHLIAYAFLDSENPFPGGYTEFVPCGISADCTDHSLIPVQVMDGTITGDIDILDWYAAADAFPPPPDGPNPPARAALLPAPLYFLHPDGQIMRVEPDGSGRKQITFANAAITDFDISPTTGLLAYVSANELHIASAFAENDTVLLTGADAEQIHSLQISPGGGRIAYALDGVSVIDIESGESQLVQANDAEGSGSGTYWPISWSPDGTRLLVARTFFTASTALQVNSVEFDDAVFLGNGCCQPSWSPDSQYVYVSGPYYGARVQPGLRRYDLYNAGAVENLIDSNQTGDTLSLLAFAQELADGQLYSFRSQPSKQEYSNLNGQALFQMTRSATDGVSDLEVLVEKARPLQDALWADDGSGAVILEPIGATTAWDATSRLRWLPADGGPAADLPVLMPTDSASRLAWGPTEEALAIAELKAQFLADVGISLAAEEDYEGVNAVVAFQLWDDVQNLWAVHTVGFRSFDPASPQDHLLGIYEQTSTGWRQQAVTAIGTEDETGFFGPDYLSQGSVAQVAVEPEAIWLEVRGGIGAHGGSYQLFRFDGSNLISQAASFSASPGGGSVSDINGDGIAEVLLDATDYYVFCYACCVRYVQYVVLHWDWDGKQMMPIDLAFLDDSAPTDLRVLNNAIVELAQAGLWKEALAQIGALDRLNGGLMGNDTVIWNIALIRLNGEAKRESEQNPDSLYPILENLFYGDYLAAVEPFQAYLPDQIFTQPSALITGTVAESWEDSIAQWVFSLSDAALPLLAERGERQSQAAAHFLRAWAAFINDPQDIAVIENIGRAVQLAADDALYQSSYAYVKGLSVQ